MKSKSVNTSVRKLQKSVRELDADLKTIVKEHDKYGINGTEEEIAQWFQCFPIETLRESIDFENHRPREKYSLQDMKKRFSLRKLHEKKKDALDKAKSDLRIAKIEILLSKIERVQHG
jgi:hypothetical protein